jgi:hypothetical protein
MLFVLFNLKQRGNDIVLLFHLCVTAIRMSSVQTASNDIWSPSEDVKEIERLNDD